MGKISKDADNLFAIAKEALDAVNTIVNLGVIRTMQQKE